MCTTVTASAAVAGITGALQVCQVIAQAALFWRLERKYLRLPPLSPEEMGR